MRADLPPGYLQTYEPMPVRMVQDGNLTTPEPPLDDDWSDLDKLRWHAGIVQHRTGLRIRVSTGGYRERIGDEWVEIPGMYGLQIGRRSLSARPYQRAWDYLNGVEIGYEEAQRESR